MFKSYIITSLRSIFLRKFFSILNLIGFALGISICITILMYVKYEFSYDKFHKNANNIYRVRYDYYQNGELSLKSAKAFPGMYNAFKSEYPEVKNISRIWATGGVVKLEDTKFKEDYVYYVDSEFISIFNPEIIEGSPDISSNSNILISESISKKYFNSLESVGKTILFNKTPMTIKGIFKDIPNNSHMKFEILISYKELSKSSPDFWDNNWEGNLTQIYLELQEGTDIKTIENRFPKLIEKYKGSKIKEGMKDVYSLQNIKDIHLKSDLVEELGVNGDYTTVLFLLAIGIIVLLIACINYVNLSISLVLERAKEIGIRKVLGALPIHIKSQFLIESFMLNFFSIIISMLIIKLTSPFFNALVGKEVLNTIFIDMYFWLFLVVLFILGTLISGIYPSLILSRFQPEETLKGKFEPNVSGLNFRKILIVFQFSTSISLIIATVVVLQQVEFLKNKNTGLDIGNVLVLNEQGIDFKDTIGIANFKVFINEIKSLSFINNISASNVVPGMENNYYLNDGSIRNPNKGLSDANTYYRVYCDYQYLPVYGIKLLVGRNFSKEFISDDKAVLLNETALKTLGFESPDDALNKDIIFWETRYKIIGIVKNYSQKSLKSYPEPTVFILNENAAMSWFINFYSIKLDTKNSSENIDKIKIIWDNIFKDKVFSYYFLEEKYKAQYDNESRLAKIFSIFSILAIFIASMGLLGLASFATIKRVKEIAIRKVLGAEMFQIFTLISKDFIKLILIANLIAWPIIYLILRKWLNNFANQISINPLIFFFTGCISVLIALISISYFIIKVSQVDPTNTLKDQ